MEPAPRHCWQKGGASRTPANLPDQGASDLLLRGLPASEPAPEARFDSKELRPIMGSGTLHLKERLTTSTANRYWCLQHPGQADGHDLVKLLKAGLLQPKYDQKYMFDVLCCMSTTSPHQLPPPPDDLILATDWATKPFQTGTAIGSLRAAEARIASLANKEWQHIGVQQRRQLKRNLWEGMHHRPGAYIQAQKAMDAVGVRFAGKQPRRKEDVQCIIGFGAGSFSPTSRGHAPGRKGAWKGFLPPYAHVVLLDGFRSSTVLTGVQCL
ncbi:hypothetical protein WJX72_002351 [[Myrmecia] bisecta]|uniref:Uncharacterized protein n=1 Tax=[Myrmecia] bisecta TaxID=41462 RepID=A0AAW1PFU0_9CHLO